MDKMGEEEPGKMASEAIKDATNPPKPPRRRLFSKLMRSAALSAGEEVIASTIMAVEDGPDFTSRVLKMAIYGSLIDTAVRHLMLKCLRFIMDKLWRWRGMGPSLKIIISLIIFTPIHKLTRFLTIAYMSGARTYHRLISTVTKVFLPSLAVLGVLGPAAVAFAHMFLPETTWVPFFRLFSLFIGVYDNILVKKAIRKMDKRAERRERRQRRSSMTPSSRSTVNQTR